jgi:hypothetical protein
MTSPSRQEFDVLGYKINSRPTSPTRINYPR